MILGAPLAGSHAELKPMKRLIVGALAMGLAVSAPASLLKAAPGAAPPPDSILPGYWEAAYTVMGIGKTERWCIQPKDISKFMHGPSNHIYHCEYPVSTAGDGVVRFEGECHSRKGRHVILK